MRATGVLLALPLPLAAAPPSPTHLPSASQPYSEHTSRAHLLDLGDERSLTPTQPRDIQAIYRPVHTHAVAPGERIVAQDYALEEFFAHTLAHKARRRQVAAEIARLNGMLGFVHLDAHIVTTRALTPAQIDAYERARGYGRENRGDADEADKKPARARTHGAHPY